MKTINAISLSAILFSPVVFADVVACDGFKIVVANQLPDRLLVTKVSLNGATITPSHIDKIDSNAKETFTVIKSKNSTPMSGVIDLHTIALPSKKVKIQFNLTNAGVLCVHSDATQNENNDYPATSSREIGAVNYTVG